MSGAGTVNGLEDRGLGAEVGAGHDAETADEPGREVRDDVPIEVLEQETSYFSGRMTRSMHAASTIRSSDTMSG
jgi:hypothetical protein